MTALAARFDRWVQAGPFTARDLGVYRIVYATLLLLDLPRADITSNVPPALWSPPLGPFRLLSGPPSHAVLLTLEVVLAVALAFLLIGLFTTAASVTVGVAYLLADGTISSYGSINHYVFYGVVPLVVCWAGWGRSFSVDAGRRTASGDRGGAADGAAQWPLRLLALCLGVGFVTAVVPKLQGGWLDSSTQAVQSFYFQRYVFTGRPSGPAGHLVDLHSRAAWEVLDWLTVALELSVLVSVVKWSWFRRVLIALVGFHVGVLLLLHIEFAPNIVAYGAFVRWSTLLPSRRPRLRPIAGAVAVATAALIAGGGLAFATLLTATGRFNVAGAYVLLGGLLTVVLLAQAALSQEVIRDRPSPTRAAGP